MEVQASGSFKPAIHTSYKLPTPNEKFLRSHVSELAKLLRNPEHMDELNKAAEYIKQEWEKLGLKVYEEPFSVGNKEFKNLKTTLGPKDGARFIIGAHYDVFGDKPGADDNASGIAGLLELSRMLVENKVQLKTPLDLVAYTLEEPPHSCLGSHVHASNLKEDKVAVKGMLSLEMIGYFSSEPNSQKFPINLMKLVYPNKGNFIAVIGYGNSFNLVRKTCSAIRQYSSIPAHMLWLPYKTLGVDRSDHGSFSNYGFQAAMITDTAEHRTPHYHKASDLPETLDYSKMAQVVKGVYGFISGQI